MQMRRMMIGLGKLSRPNSTISDEYACGPSLVAGEATATEEEQEGEVDVDVDEDSLEMDKRDQGKLNDANTVDYEFVTVFADVERKIE